MPNYDLDMNLDVVPYCADLAHCKYRVEDAGPIYDCFRRFMPAESAKKLDACFYAGSSDNAGEKLEILCEALRDTVLPYVQTYTDFDVFYEEHKLAFAHRGKEISRDPYIFGLSIKIHRYEEALLHVDYRLTQYSKQMEDARAKIMAIESGNISPTLLSIKRTRPDIIEFELGVNKSAIIRLQKAIGELALLKKALLAGDDDYLDSYVLQVERNSRNYIDEMLNRYSRS